MLTGIRGDGMANLVFFDQSHTYEVDGEPVPSVSEVTRFLSREIYGDITQFQLDNAAERGTAVHKALEVLDKYSEVEAAEDIVQTLMSRLLEYKEPEKLLRMTPQELQSYAMRAVFNMALDRKRRLMREQAWITQPAEEDYTDLGDFQDMEMKELLYRLVARLPEKEREVMELYLEDPELTQEEIAQRLGLHRITVNRRYKRAVKIMRILYRTQEYDT